MEFFLPFSSLILQNNEENASFIPYTYIVRLPSSLVRLSLPLWEKMGVSRLPYELSPPYSPGGRAEATLFPAKYIGHLNEKIQGNPWKNGHLQNYL